MEAESERPGLLKEIEQVINRYSTENRSNTPDFILANYLIASLAAFDQATNRREEWYGRQGEPRTGALELVVK